MPAYVGTEIVSGNRVVVRPATADFLFGFLKHAIDPSAPSNEELV